MENDMTNSTPLRVLVLIAGLGSGTSATLAQNADDENSYKAKYECHTWAIQETGFQPDFGGGPTTHAPYSDRQPLPEAKPAPNERVKNTVIGGLLGSAVGAAAGNAGVGGVVGGLAGALFGGGSKKSNNSSAPAATSIQPAQDRERGRRKANYERAYATCMQTKTESFERKQNSSSSNQEASSGGNRDNQDYLDLLIDSDVPKEGSLSANQDTIGTHENISSLARIDLGWTSRGMDRHGTIRICEPRGCNLFGKGDTWTWYFNNEVTTDYDLLKEGVICDVVKREVTDAERERLGKSYSVMHYAEFFVCGDDRNIAAAMKLEAEKKAALEQKRIALEKEKAEKARLAKIQKENEKREWQEELNKRRTQSAQWAPAYLNREKSLMEEVFNYATFGDPEGSLTKQGDGSFRGQAYEESPKCVMTGHFIDSNGLRKGDPINARKINQTAFRITSDMDGAFEMKIGRQALGDLYSPQTYVISTDYAVLRIRGPGKIAHDRLQKAWGLAFAECPGKKSRF